MPKILIIAKTTDSIPDFTAGEIVAQVEPGAAAIAAIQDHQPDLVLMSDACALILNQAFITQSVPRQYIRATTHQGIQLVPIQEVDYFQAEHKYVITYHKQGQLLIADSLDKLETEFTQTFIRIHRKSLVANSMIEKLIRNEDGQHYIKLRGYTELLPISRRQLSKVRKLLLCT